MSTGRPLAPQEKAFVDAATRLMLVVIIAAQATAGYTDSDIWGHMSIGLDMLRTRSFLWADPYSFTHDQTWINHEWLWDVAVASLYRAGGLPAVLALRAVLVGAVLCLVQQVTRRVPNSIQILTLFVIGIVCIGQWRSTRPQIASLALYAVLLARIEAPWLPLLFTLWANIHGGWLFGILAVCTRAVVTRSRRTILLTVACVAGTLVNPYGFHLWGAIADAMSRGWADVSEWQPVWRWAAGIEAPLLWILLAGAVAFLWRRTTHDPWAWAWTLVSLAAAAGSRRLIALAGVTSAMLLIPLWTPEAEQPSIEWTRGRRWVFAAVAAAGFAGALVFIQPTARCFPPLPQWRAPEPDAVAFLRTSDVRRVVPHFDFGEYAIFHLRDRVKVAIDNRRETVYSDVAVQANQRFADGRDPEYPDRIGADAVWWPSNGTRVLEGLEARGWVRRFEGPRTVVLMRSAGPLVRGANAIGTPCFPNP